MRYLILSAAFVLALALGGTAQAGEGCPYSKSRVDTAATESNGQAAPVACARECPHAKNGDVASACACSRGEEAGEIAVEATDGQGEAVKVSTDGEAVASNN